MSIIYFIYPIYTNNHSYILSVRHKQKNCTDLTVFT